METQLRLIDSPVSSPQKVKYDWELTARDRRIGRIAVAKARLALANAKPPEPVPWSSRRAG